MAYKPKIHVADGRVVTSSQDFTPAICKKVVAFRNTTKDIPKATCKNCERVVRSANRSLDA